MKPALMSRGSGGKILAFRHYEVAPQASLD